jgi:hypothetical protein
VPDYQYPQGYIVEVIDGTYERDPDNQRLYYYPDEKDVPKWIRIKPTVPRQIEDAGASWLRASALTGLLLVLLWWWRSRQTD